MATVNLGIGTNPFPNITDDIQIALYDALDPAAVVTAQQNTAPHPQRAWNFPGLPVANYIFRIFQMVASTSVVRQQLGGDMEVVPGAQTQVTYWEDEQITADTTMGFSSGVNTVVFDGTGGKEDWRGRDIATLVRMGGEGVMKKGVEYSWNINTGTLLLLVAGDVFNPSEWFNVTFGLLVNTVTASAPTILPPFLTPKIITANYTVNAGTDFGGNLIIRPAGTYLEITMPALSAVPANKLLTLEFDPPPAIGGNPVQQCAKIIFQAGEVMAWLLSYRNNLYICNQERISFYKFIDPLGPQWRPFNPFGNWLTLGDEVINQNATVNMFNRVLMDGGTLNGTSANGLDTQQFARFYNDFVLNLPGAEVCNYDSWATGSNIYLYSLANSANPANAGRFRIPNKLNTFERMTDGTRVPGNLQLGQNLQHFHNNGVADDTAGAHPYSLSVYGTTVADMPGNSTGQPDIVGSATTRQGITSVSGGTENRPANIAVRKYLLV